MRDGPGGDGSFRATSLPKIDPLFPLQARLPPTGLWQVQGALYLVDVDGDIDDNMQQVSQSQAGDQDIGSITHALVLVDDSQQRGVPDDA